MRKNGKRKKTPKTKIKDRDKLEFKMLQVRQLTKSNNKTFI